MQFEDIRPYHDEEYPVVMNRLLAEPAFVQAVQGYFSEYSIEQLRQLLLSCSTVTEFQQRIVSAVVERIISHSMQGVQFSGLEQLDPATPYLFMSNHRDIVLDSALLNYGLHQAGFPTSEIAIGSNLLGIPWVRDLVRINKSFIVKRNLPNQEMLQASRVLSAYISHTLLEKRASVWIAQREGRAKDGNDQTNPGLLKMLGLGVDKVLLEHLRDLNIVTVSISYEYDPCDYLKLPELIARSKGEMYQKRAGEDVQHMLQGIQGYKGRTQLTFGRPLRDEMAHMAEVKNRNEQLRMLAQLIDQQIYRNYHLWPSNYISADLLLDVPRFRDHYNMEDRQDFLAYMEDRIAKGSDEQSARRLFLQMYANPVFNHIGEPLATTG